MSDDKAFFAGIAQVILEMQRGTSRHTVAVGGGLDPAVAALRQWQTWRLQQTYSDFLKSDYYAPACQFFLDDIYAPRDFSQRDHDIETLYNLASKFIPAEVLSLFNDVIWLNRLTNALDQALVAALMDKLHVPLDCGMDALNADLYAEGYRVCDNYEARQFQIELLGRIIVEVGKGTHNPLVGITLRAAALPARTAGWGDLHRFAVHGVKAFNHMKKPQAFAQTIQQREMIILDRIFEKHADPFGFAEEETTK